MVDTFFPAKRVAPSNKLPAWVTHPIPATIPLPNELQRLPKDIVQAFMVVRPVELAVAENL